MESLLGPLLTNIVLSHHEESWSHPVKFVEVCGIFLYFLHHPNLSTRFDNIMSPKYQNNGSLAFSDVTFCHKNLSLAFTKSQNLVEVSPIAKVSFHYT